MLNWKILDSTFLDLDLFKTIVEEVLGKINGLVLRFHLVAIHPEVEGEKQTHHGTEEIVQGIEHLLCMQPASAFISYGPRGTSEVTPEYRTRNKS